LDEAHNQLPEHDELIEPIKGRFERPADAVFTPSVARSQHAGRGRQIVAGIALTVLLLVAGVVVFVLPRWVEDQQASPAPIADAVPESVDQTPVEPILSEEELARLRDEAEALLAELLSQQAQLAGLSAESWGGEQWVEYESAARAGDDAYLADAFQDAVPAYTRALEVGEALLGRSAEIILAAIRAGATALEAGNASVAIEQFTLVLGIEPENQTAKDGLARAERLPEVLTLVRQGELAERDDALEDAARAYRDALAIDPGWVPARSALSRVEAQIQAGRFDRLMSAAYAALAAEDYDDAFERFDQALKLRPGSQEAQNGQLQAEQGMRLDQIALIEARAAAFERRELWSQAIEQYEAAIATDATLVFAQQGLERARLRADLDAKLAHVLANPNLLFDDTVLADANGMLIDAQAVVDAGPRLTEQKTELARLIRLAATPIEVELRSDQLTEVTLYRIGELGTFSETRVELRPGTYTAVGSRDGFRDVRETFTVLPGRELAPIRVECVEPI